MNFFDPARPQHHGRPCFLSIPYTLPGFYIIPQDELLVRLLIFYPVGNNRFSHGELIVNKAWVETTIQEYINDPEEFLRDRFSWEYSEAPKKRTNITLEDIEL